MDLAKTHVPATIYQILVMFVSHAIQIEELAVTLGNLTVLRARKVSSCRRGDLVQMNDHRCMVPIQTVFELNVMAIAKRAVN